ncbi:MAG: FAD-dependent oxidoreductase [Acidobacteria bacterium]|nr:putative thiazole biosynthetic enzyme [Pyrinomonadaceae bacterium]RIJ90430.1 MAG: FAD-dependent oxidoreductase [Acidobacteriota bacterium]
MKTNSGTSKAENKKVVIIGAGPAGLTAAYELCKAGVRSVVLEKDDVVGGISRTVNYKGYLFDIGGHRFFTKVKAVDEMWREVLGEKKFLRRSRLSRIYYQKKFFYYPLKASNALLGLGIWNSIMMVFSYLKAQMFPVKNESTFEDWISNRFGKRLYNTFFKTYTEKVWGIPCDKISADWAAQRIKGLSLVTTIKNALLPTEVKDKGEIIKTLIDAFDYPAKGPGMMWEMVAESIQKDGSSLKMKSDVDRIFWQKGRVTALEIENGSKREVVEGTDFISSMPMQELVRKMSPEPPAEVLAAADKLGYRDFLTVSLVVNKEKLFEDNWIYIHDPDVKVGRIQNFKNWSPHMVPDPSKTCLGLEYFCFEGDGLWTMDDADLIALGAKELGLLQLVDPADVEDGAVVRMPKAYPVYDAVYMDAVDTIRDFLREVPNLHLVGRNGMHKYNNQDHSMLTAMLSVKNILGANYDVWGVNVDNEYHEEISAQEESELSVISSTQPLVPTRIA